MSQIISHSPLLLGQGPSLLMCVHADQGVGSRQLLVSRLAEDTAKQLNPLPRFAKQVDPDLDVDGGNVEAFLANAGADEDPGLLPEMVEG